VLSNQRVDGGGDGSEGGGGSGCVTARGRSIPEENV